MQFKDLLAGIAIMVIWGFNFAVIKLGVNQIDPLLLTGLRFLFAAIPAVFFVRRPDVSWRYLIGYGLVFGVGVWGMMTWSIEAGISAGMAGLLLQFNVLLGLLVGWLLLKERLKLRQAIGALVALSGLFLSVQLNDGSISAAGIVLVAIAAVCWTLTSVLVKSAKTPHVFAFMIWGMLFAPIPLFALSIASHGFDSLLQLPQHLNAPALFSVLFQAYPTTLLGYWVFNRLLVKYPLSTVAPLTLLVPVFGLIGGVVFYQEAMGSQKILACVLVIGGLAISQIAWQKLFKRQMVP
ncbi:EamA family transporter [Pelagibaculum spongiae]|uniref:EamA domain-containing protein n=1 Tax=Pelagibaculum spongiae TaxID=2080658 RepID=A0A2V1GTT0_9GAMM|nr:EamA family transporter [Pelagibaculum spongiae]PVZ69028.1 hypothetical protein DC094_12410 [Pelagibaculum spongiae]